MNELELGLKEYKKYKKILVDEFDTNEEDGLVFQYYDDYQKGIPGDIEFYVEEAKKSGSPVLELGCGTGRILIPIAEAGIEIIGADIDIPMLEKADEKIKNLLPETQKRIELRKGDMKNFDYPEKFSLIIAGYSLFYYLKTPEEWKQTLLNIKNHLKDNGKLIIDYFNIDSEWLHFYTTPAGQNFVEQKGFISSKTGNRVIFSTKYKNDIENQLLYSTWRFQEIDEVKKIIYERIRKGCMRWSYRYETQYLLELCGYQVESLYGDFQRNKFRSGPEQRQIWIAQRE